MFTFKHFIKTKLIRPLLAKENPRHLGICVFAIALLVSFAGSTAQAQTGGTANCVIASNDERNGFRTDEITSCRVNTSNGNTSFVMNNEQRSRSYAAIEPLTTRHLEVAAFWLQRVGQIRVPAGTNPNRFDPQEFLREASQATHGFVLVRKKRSGRRALNVVYITNGVYRSIDFSGTNLKEMPAGFLITR